MHASVREHLCSKRYAGQSNGALCKVQEHSIYVLMQAIYELGIEPIS